MCPLLYYMLSLRSVVYRRQNVQFGENELMTRDRCCGIRTLLSLESLDNILWSIDDPEALGNTAVHDVSYFLQDDSLVIEGVVKISTSGCLHV